MEGQPQAPAASSAPAPATEPAVQAPESTPQQYATWQDRLARAFDTLPADDPRTVSNGQPAAPAVDDDEDDDDEDGTESTPRDSAEGVKPATADQKTADAPTPTPETGEKPLSRRQQREAERQKQIDDLQAQIAERDAALEQAREQARAEARAEIEREQAEAPTRQQQEALAAQAAADVERYERLIRLPVNDLDADDFNWLEERKDLLRKYPEAEAHFRAETDRVLTERQQFLEADHQKVVNKFWEDRRADMKTAKDLPGVDFDALLGAETFAEQYRLLHQAGAAAKDAEYQPQIAAKDAEIAKHTERISELEDEIRDLRLVGPRGLGSSRAPVRSGVRSGDAEASPRKFDEHRSSKDNLAAALGF